MTGLCCKINKVSNYYRLIFPFDLFKLEEESKWKILVLVD